MSFDTLMRILASPVANGGTFTVQYPPNRGAGSYTGGRFHEVNSFMTGRLTAESGRVSFSFGASEITVTNLTGQTIPAGAELVVQLDRIGPNEGSFNLPFASPDQMAELKTIIVSLGAPIASAANNIVASQAATALSGLATGINGAIAANGVAVLDVPRAVVAAWTGTAVVTIHGFDQYGQPMRQSSASGTSLTGTKAFKRVTNVTTSADITGLTVGTSKVLGLPVFLPGAGHVLRTLQNGAIPTQGVIAAGDLTAPSATTGDVRGTYAPNTNPNGSNSIQLVLALDDVAFKGLPQF
jgi:hypothetical protein